MLHPGSRIACCTADGTSTLRDYWAASVQHRNPFSFSFDALDGAPQGLVRTPATVLANGGLQTAFVWWLRGPLGAVAAWNLFLFLGVVATAIATFVLLERLGCSFTASLFGAYVFAFSPYAFERAYAGHLGLLQNWVLVLVAGALLGLRERRSLTRAAAVGAAVALAFYVSAYQGLLAGFAAFVFLAVELVRLRGRREWLRSALLGAAVYLVAALALLPILILYARERSTVRAEVSHHVGEISNLSAKATAYLLPSPRNPLFHWLGGFHPLDLTEQTLFFGYTTVALALAAVLLLRRGDPWLQASERRLWTAVFAAVLAPAAVLVLAAAELPDRPALDRDALLGAEGVLDLLPGLLALRHPVRARARDLGRARADDARPAARSPLALPAAAGVAPGRARAAPGERQSLRYERPPRLGHLARGATTRDRRHLSGDRPRPDDSRRVVPEPRRPAAIRDRRRRRCGALSRDEASGC